MAPVVPAVRCALGLPAWPGPACPVPSACCCRDDATAERSGRGVASRVWPTSRIPPVQTGASGAWAESVEAETYLRGGAGRGRGGAYLGPARDCSAAGVRRDPGRGACALARAARKPSPAAAPAA